MLKNWVKISDLGCDRLGDAGPATATVLLGGDMLAGHQGLDPIG